MIIIVILFVVILIIINYEKEKEKEYFAQNYGHIELGNKGHLILMIDGKKYRVFSGTNGCESACFGNLKLVPED